MMVVMNMEAVVINMAKGIDTRCIECFQKTYLRLRKKYFFTKQQSKEFSEFMQKLMEDKDVLSSPEIQRELHHKLYELSGVTDPFYEEKKQSNHIALNLYKYWKQKLSVSENPFNMALRLSIAGNIMDFGANHSFNIFKTIEDVFVTKFAIDHSELLKERISKAKNILYLGDNAGEIVFDKLFIETIHNRNVCFVVKGSPIINDVTMDDAYEVNMHDVADVISNGYDAPSTVLKKSSLLFQEMFKSADLIISKGQGNLEGLLNENDSRIFFLLTVKCEVIAESIGVQKGSFVVYNQSKL
ncbi:MAG TPA: hypothetical protein DEH02_15820 [Bacteroidales bacterium]|nr:hypothetical protein [Bacteroidales bacterium]